MSTSVKPAHDNAREAYVGLRALATQAWEHRFSARLGLARALLVRLEDGLSESSISLCPSERAAMDAEVALLNASFARSEMNLADAEKWIDKASCILRDSGLPESFQLVMQTALGLDAQSRWAESLRLYQAAVRIAQGPFETLAAKFNLAVCQYNLDLPNQKLLDEIENELKASQDHPIRRGFKQIRLMDVKRAFLDARIDAIDERAGDLELSQETYFRAWLGSLPWSTCKNSRIDDFIGLSSGEEEFFQKHYRLQTLKADTRLLGGELEESPLLQLQVDRLYLWTWKWLENPTQSQANLLERELAQFPFEKAHLTLTSEDVLMLESLGGWLSLFDSPFARGFDRWKGKYLPAKLQPSYFFEVDRRCRELLCARQDSELAEFAEGVRVLRPSLSGYFDLIRRLASGLPSESFIQPKQVVVRPEDHTITHAGQTTISPQGSALLCELVRRGSISFPEALLIAFEIPGYDELIHAPKINNLIQRLKKILPHEVHLRTKAKRIYIEDPGSVVRIPESNPHRAHFPRFEFQAVTEAAKKQSLHLEKKVEVDFQATLTTKFADSSVLTRRDIEGALTVSKATANRWIAHWISTGVLAKTGDARETKYVFKHLASTHQLGSKNILDQ